MSRRVLAVLATRNDALPPGLADAMLTDVVDMVTDTEHVDAAIAVPAGRQLATGSWPGVAAVGVPADPTLAAVLQEVARSDSTAVAVVVADAPDLPPLLLGKLFSAMAGPRGAAVAVCPAEDGGLVAIAAMVPLVPWLTQLSLRVDDRDALDALRAAAPLAELSVGPGWHRIREPADLTRLDPGLEGWEATRAQLS
jgi:hypothetical protein